MNEPQRPVVLGVIVAPGLPSVVTAKIADDLAEDLRASFEIPVEATFVVDRLVSPRATLTELVDAARRLLLERDWDYALVVTDLPLKLGARPVSRHVSPTHGVAVLSLPALGALHLGRRLRQALHDLAHELIGAPGAVGGKAPGYLRLLLGMIRANRPWRLALRLYGVLAAALAAGTLGVVDSDIWRLAAAAGWARLAAVSVASITLTILAVIVAHELWERSPDPRDRYRVLLFNLTTFLTVVIGIVVLYATLFVLVFIGANLLIPGSVFEQAVGRDADRGDFLMLAWLVASFATVAGALGTLLESDAVAREAAYGGAAAEE